MLTTTPFAADPVNAPAQPGPVPLPNAVGFSFSRCPGETPRAFGAFLVYFQMSRGRSLQGLADKIGEGLPTIKNWSSKYSWTERLDAFQSGLARQEVEQQTVAHRKNAAQWADRLNRFREQEWDASQKLLAAAQCFLENFGDEDLQKMTLAQVSRALRISSDIGRLSLAGAELPASSEPEISPLQQQMLDAVKRVYGEAAAGTTSTSSPSSPSEVRMASSPSPASSFTTEN